MGRRRIRALLVTATVIIGQILGTLPGQAQSSGAGAPASRPAQAAIEGSSLLFVPNRGQHPAEVSFTTLGSNPAPFFTPTGITYALNEQPSVSGRADRASSRRAWAVRQEFVGARPTIPLPTAPAPTTVNYLVGPVTGHIPGLATAARITYPNLWDGIDLHYRGEGSALKYEFHVAPGVDARVIELAYRGAKSVKLTTKGALRISTPVASFTDGAPIAWQDTPAGRIPVEVVYESRARGKGSLAYGFALGDYDATLPLVIDPIVLVYSSFLGGEESFEAGNGIAVDATGSAFVSGHTNSVDFPVTLGAYDTLSEETVEAFVAKVAPDGSSLIYATFLGGTGSDEGAGIAIDASGAAHVTGRTTSVNFPTTPGAFDTVLGGFQDAFVAKLSPDGSTLAYGTYLGGSAEENDAVSGGIAVDAVGAVAVSGTTDSTDFPVPGGFDPSLGGGRDAFMARIDVSGTGLQTYGTYIGGSGLETVGIADAVGLGLDPSGAAYVSGFTDSADFPILGGFDAVLDGGADAYVVKVLATGVLGYSTFLGGSGADGATGVSVDPTGAAYVTGITTSGDFPTPSGFDTVLDGGLDAFVAKIAPGGGSIVYGTYLGGSSGTDFGLDVATDAAGAAWVVGLTESDDFPVADGFDTVRDDLDMFVAKVAPGGGVLAFGTFLGGTAEDFAGGFSGRFTHLTGIAVDPSGAAYVTGATFSSDFPTTPGAFDTTLGGFLDGLVAKIGEPAEADLSFSKTASDSSVDRGEHLTYTLTVSNSGPAAATGVSVSDTLPDEVAFESATPSQGTCAFASGTVTCTLGTIASGDSATIEIEVDAYHAGTATNTACAASEVEDPDDTNNCDEVSVRIRNIADLELAKTASPDPAMVGEPLTYTLTIHNQGPSEADDAVLVDHLPASVEFVSASSTQGSCPESGGVVTCDLGDIEDDDTVTVTIVVTPTQAGEITNRASVDSDTRDDDDDDNEVRLTTTVVEPANLSVTAASSSPAYAGEAFTYSITVSNAGPFQATDVVLDDTLPAGVELLSSASSQGSCQAATCALGTLGSGVHAQIELTVRPEIEGDYTNTASVSGSTHDPSPEDNTAATTATVHPAADLSLGVQASASRVDAGDDLTYLIEVANAGPSVARDVVVTDQLPEGYRPTGWSASQGECALSDSTLTCALADLASGASASIRIEGVAETLGSYDNTASVQAETHDADPADNSALAETISADVTDPIVTLTRALPGHLYIEAAGLDIDLGAALQHAIIATPITEFELRADATDDFELERVDFYVNDVRVCSDTQAPYTCAWIPMVSSLARVEAEAVDAWGNVGARDGVDVLVGL